MNSTEEQLRTQLAEAEAKLETEKRLHRSALIFVDQGYAREAELRAKLAEAEAKCNGLKSEIESLEQELSEAKETVAEEFEKDAGKVLWKILCDTGYEVEPYEGWTPQDALEHITECFRCEDEDRKRRTAEAAKIIKPFADMRALCGENEREAIMARMLGGVDCAWEDRRVCLEVRHLTAALGWIKENGNG